MLYKSISRAAAMITTSDSSSVITAQDVAKNYGNNPTITTTALAHSLWSSVLRKDIDTVIDATAGNGGDCIALARMLFSSAFGDIKSSADEVTVTTSQAQLLAVDIQEQACHNTFKKLATMLPGHIMRDNVQVLHTSHAPLPLPRDTSSVALVVYNLGFLPQSAENKDHVTTTETTIASLADAALLLRIGGVLSVMTYPRTNKEEDFAVRSFLEGLALFTSVTQSWETYVQHLDCSAALHERLAVTLQHVLEEGGSKQTWRVHEHKKLGWVDAPILLTATRIK